MLLKIFLILLENDLYFNLTLMKKLSKKEQAQLLVDKFFAFYFKRYEKKNIDEIQDDEKAKIIGKNHSEWIYWYDEKEERQMFLNHLKQVTWMKYIEPAFMWLWRVYKPLFLKDE